jgi:hypothetical protein
MKLADFNGDWKIDSYSLSPYSLVWFLNIQPDFSLEELFQFNAEKDGFFGRITVSYRKLRRRIQLSIFLIYPI